MLDARLRDAAVLNAGLTAGLENAASIAAANPERPPLILADFALGWVLNNKLVTAAITGPRTEAHWDGYLRALDVKLDAEDEALVDSLVVPGHASTPGYNDPGHPLEGRVARG